MTETTGLRFVRVQAAGDEDVLRDWPVVIDTVVLGSNEGGLRFAERHGFTETGRYVLPGDEIPYVELRLGPQKQRL